MYTMCKQITMRWLFCNKVEICWWKSDRYKKKTHMRDREMSGKMKRLKMKMEVQEITFNYFTRPQPRDLNIYVMMMAIQKYCCPWFQNLLWVYVMAWMRVRFPGLKFCPSPPLVAPMCVSCLPSVIYPSVDLLKIFWLDHHLCACLIDLVTFSMALY